MKRAQKPIRILPQIFLWRVNFTNPDPGRLLRPAMARCKAHGLGSTARCRSSQAPARRTGEQRPTEIRRDGTQPTGGAYVLPIPVHQGCRDQRWRLSKPVPWARQRGVYRLSSPADRRAASEDLSQIPPPAHLLRALPGRGARDTDPMRWVASPAAAQGRRNGWKQAIKPAEGLTARGALRRVRKSE